MTRKGTHSNPQAGEVGVSIAVFAWNEEEAIETTLESLLAQSFFARLSAAGERAEVICVLNGCTDGTAIRATDFFNRQSVAHPAAHSFTGKVADLPERGKMNAWNQFVHRLSAPTARVLFMMDADILIHRPDTLWNMCQLLEQSGDASVAVDLPCKDISARSVKAALSGSMAAMTRSAEAQLCGQLYAIRARVARSIYIPKDLSACEDGFLKSMVCTDLLEHEVWPQRLQLAADAAHTFEAYTSVPAIIRNQKRQILGQTMVHVLVDQYLAGLPAEQRGRMAAQLKARDQEDPEWLRRLVGAHVRRTRVPWRLYPDLLSQHFGRLRRVRGARKLACLPATMAALALSLFCSFLAFRSLRAGSFQYWPKAQRAGFKPAQGPLPPRVELRAQQ